MQNILKDLIKFPSLRKYLEDDTNKIKKHISITNEGLLEIPSASLLSFFTCLESIDFSNNQIRYFSATSFVNGCPALKSINLKNNLIDSIDMLIEFRSIKLLKDLNVNNNPICKKYTFGQLLETLILQEDKQSKGIHKLMMANYESIVVKNSSTHPWIKHSKSSSYFLKNDNKADLTITANSFKQQPFQNIKIRSISAIKKPTLPHFLLKECPPRKFGHFRNLELLNEHRILFQDIYLFFEFNKISDIIDDFYGWHNISQKENSAHLSKKIIKTADLSKNSKNSLNTKLIKNYLRRNRKVPKKENISLKKVGQEIIDQGYEVVCLEKNEKEQKEMKEEKFNREETIWNAEYKKINSILKTKKNTKSDNPKKSNFIENNLNGFLAEQNATQLPEFEMITDPEGEFERKKRISEGMINNYGFKSSIEKNCDEINIRKGDFNKNELTSESSHLLQKKIKKIHIDESYQFLNFSDSVSKLPINQLKTNQQTNYKRPIQRKMESIDIDIENKSNPKTQKNSFLNPKSDDFASKNSIQFDRISENCQKRIETLKSSKECQKFLDTNSKNQKIRSKNVLIDNNDNKSVVKINQEKTETENNKFILEKKELRKLSKSSKSEKKILENKIERKTIHQFKEEIDFILYELLEISKVNNLTELKTNIEEFVALQKQKTNFLKNDCLKLKIKTPEISKNRQNSNPTKHLNLKNRTKNFKNDFKIVDSSILKSTKNEVAFKINEKSPNEEKQNIDNLFPKSNNRSKKDILFYLLNKYTMLQNIIKSSQSKTSLKNEQCLIKIMGCLSNYFQKEDEKANESRHESKIMRFFGGKTIVLFQKKYEKTKKGSAGKISVGFSLL